MKLVRETVTAFYAFDGRRFDNSDACIKYERERLPLVEQFWQDRLRRNGVERRRCKKHITEVEGFITDWRTMAVSLLKTRKALRNYHVCSELQDVFGQLASQLNNRRIYREKLDENRREYKKLRAGIDELKTRGKTDEK